MTESEQGQGTGQDARADAQERYREKMCFCIMPIRPHKQEELDYYSHSGGEDHFRMVFSEVFDPAVSGLAGGYWAKFPTLTTAGTIPAELLSILLDAPLCLADISTFNPNVFVEIGIRLAADKPLCIVGDERTKGNLPFDTGALGHYFYSSSILSSTVREDVPHITAMLQSALDQHSKSSYWKIFNVGAAVAQLPQGPADVGQVLQVLLARLERIEEQLGSTIWNPAGVKARSVSRGPYTAPPASDPAALSRSRIRILGEELQSVLGPGVIHTLNSVDPRYATLQTQRPLAPEECDAVWSLAHNRGYYLLIMEKVKDGFEIRGVGERAPRPG